MLTKTVLVLLAANFLCVQSQFKGKYFRGIAQTNKPSDVQGEIGQEIVGKDVVPPTYPQHTESILTESQQEGVESPVTRPIQVKSNIVDHPLLTEEEKAAVKNAKYRYGYKIDDRIKGGWNEKMEERKDGKVTGYYKYDDRNILRKVTYEADENGFRVISDEILPSERRDIELTGTAAVETINNDDHITGAIETKTTTKPAHVNEITEKITESVTEPVYVDKITEKTTKFVRGRKIRLV